MKKDAIGKYNKTEGLPIMLIRKLVKIGLGRYIYMEDVKLIFSCKTKVSIRKIIRSLERLGYIERYEDIDLWVNTIKGNILAHSEFKRPIKREKANKIINEVIQRIKAVNTSQEYLYFINELYVVGDYLEETLDEIDKLEIAIQIRNKYDFKKQQKFVDERRQKSKKYFPTIFDWAAYPQSEIKPFLKSRIHNLDIYDYFIFKDNEVPSKLIYQRQFE